MPTSLPFFLFLKMCHVNQVPVATPVILATWEAEIWRTVVQGSLGK
jgi:hypothetical protein